MSGHAIVFLRQGGSYPDKDQGPACMINVQRPEYKTKQGGAKRKQDRNKKNLTAFWHLRLLQQLLLFNRPWQQRGPWTGINPETVSNFHVMWGQQHVWSQCTLCVLFVYFVVMVGGGGGASNVDGTCSKRWRWWWGWCKQFVMIVMGLVQVVLVVHQTAGGGGSGSEAAPGDCFHMDEYFKEVKLHRMIWWWSRLWCWCYIQTWSCQISGGLQRQIHSLLGFRRLGSGWKGWIWKGFFVYIKAAGAWTVNTFTYQQASPFLSL